MSRLTGKSVPSGDDVEVHYSALTIQCGTSSQSVNPSTLSITMFVVRSFTRNISFALGLKASLQDNLGNCNIFIKEIYPHQGPSYPHQVPHSQKFLNIDSDVKELFKNKTNVRFNSIQTSFGIAFRSYLT